MGALRLFLAISVVTWHLGLRGDLPTGYVAVLLFYMISGFYMSMVINDKYSKLPESTWRFYLARLLRIWPLYFVVLLLTLWFDEATLAPTPYTGTFGEDIDPVARVLLSLSNLSIFGLDVVPFTLHFPPPDFRIVPPGWTLAIEFQFYLAAPFIVRRPLWLLLGLLSVLIAIRLSLLDLEFVRWRYFFAPSVWCFFMLGVIAHGVSGLVTDHRLRKKIGLAAAPIVVIVGYLAGATVEKDLDRPELWTFYLTFAASIPFIFELTKSWRFDNLIGELCYPVYLVHLLIISFVLHRFPALVWSVPLVGASQVIIYSLLAAAVLLFVVDRPIDALRARVMSARRRPAANLALPEPTSP
ncbi:MAG: acyltransferase family protein [Steroidobacteraceae bacterium]